METKQDEVLNAGDEATQPETPPDPGKNPSSENAPGGESDTSKAQAEAKEERRKRLQAMKKDELVEYAELADDNIATLIAGQQAAVREVTGIGNTDMGQPGGDTRRKMNRGSTRRLNKAHAAFQENLKTFRDEVDRQVYETEPKPDDWPEDKPFEPKRIGECRLVKRLDAIKKEVQSEMNSYMH